MEHDNNFLDQNANISLADLKLKLKLFFEQTSAPKLSETGFLDTQCLIKHSLAYILHFYKNTKASKKEHPNISVKYYPYNENKSMYICHRTNICLQKIRFCDSYHII